MDAMNYREQTRALIDRVAKAIRWGRFEASLTESELAEVSPTFWEDMPEWQRDDYRIMAKHALAVTIADAAPPVVRIVDNETPDA